ncbi:hypothetical protein GCM10009648_44120 [Tsukamurella spumae]
MEVWDSGRLERLSWLIPDGVLYTHPLPVLSFIEYSNITLIGAALFAAVQPMRRLGVIAAISLPLTVTVAYITGLGIIPGFRIFVLLFGLVSTAIALVVVRRSRSWITRKKAANSYFYSTYWPLIKDDSAKAAQLATDEEKGRRDWVAFERSTRNRKLFDNRNNSSGDWQKFIDAERSENNVGRSSMPGTLGVNHSFGQRSLGEIIAASRSTPWAITPEELAHAADISVSDAQCILSRGRARDLSPHAYQIYLAINEK